MVLFIAMLSSEAGAGNLPIPVALYPLNGRHGTSDIGPNKNPPGISSDVQLAAGPFGHPKGSYQFSGTSSSYIELPNNGGLDTRYSITILAWVNPKTKDGPLFNYNPGGWNVHFWLVDGALLARPVTRNNRFLEYITSSTIPTSVWHYVGTTYDFSSGVVRLWVNGEEVADATTDSEDQSTQYDVRIGAKTDDPRYFKGRICCIQLYNKALSEQEIVAVRNRTANTVADVAERSYISGHFQPALSPQQRPGDSLAAFKDSNVTECLLRCSRMSDCNSVAIDGIPRKERSNGGYCQLYRGRFEPGLEHENSLSDKQYYNKHYK